MEDYIERGIENTHPEEVFEFINTILIHECGVQGKKQLTRSIQKFFSEYRPDKECFVALYRENTLRAIMAVDHHSDTRAILKWVFVSPRDRRRGIASQLLDRAICFARHTGYSRLVLGTLTDMETAHRLYKKKGFLFQKRVTFWRQPMLVYEKPLNSTPSSGPSL